MTSKIKRGKNISADMSYDFIEIDGQRYVDATDFVNLSRDLADAKDDLKEAAKEQKRPVRLRERVEGLVTDLQHRGYEDVARLVKWLLEDC